MSTHPDTARRISPTALEPIMAETFPAQGSSLGPNGILRTSHLPHRRVNAVWAYGPGVTEEHVSEAEATYEALGQDVVFKLSGVPQLDTALRALGYVEEAPTPVFAITTKATLFPDHVVISDEHELESAISFWMQFTGKPSERLPLYLESYSLCPGQLGVAFALSHSEVVAVGMVHSFLDTAVISNVATSPEARKQGHGRAVTQALMSWANDQGAGITALQVEADNTAALSVYQELGFEKAYDSWYLRKVRNHHE